MEDIESLRKRKEELLLRKQVERLEAAERRATKAKDYSWWWAGPLAAVGAWIAIAGTANLGDGGFIVALIGAGLMYPAGAKLMAKQ